MNFGAQNNIEATVVDIQKGDVMCRVKVKLEGTAQHMSSVMTTESMNSLGLKVGDTVKVVVKAVNVLLAK